MNNIELYKFLWAIIVVIVPYFINNIQIKLAEGVWVNEYHNEKKAFCLIEVEVIGSMLVHGVAFIISSFIGDGFIYWVVGIFLYFIVVIVIINVKTEHGKNILYGICF